MPYKRKTPSKRKPKRRTMTRRKTRIPRSIPSGIEKCKLVKLTYADQIRLDPQLGGVPSTHVFRANSVYDPDFSIVGHQPMYHDQYSALYGTYKVFGAKITITGANDYSDSNNVMGNLIICQLTKDPSAVSSFTQALERKNTKYGQCQEKRNFKLQTFYSAKKFHCITDVKDSVQLQGLTGNLGTGTSPSDEAYFVVSAHPLYKGQDTYPACLNITIEYIVKYFDLKNISGS